MRHMSPNITEVLSLLVKKLHANVFILTLPATCTSQGNFSWR